ncbi:hypothetical protein [Schinkia azotoformans]|uniref:hypothetical protein n=1 Tax=Schinkia azotoformans TaxID=1454 RepID=UPI002DBEEA6E|nr:hypothetical protein [Schinkia azotoformans]MEC1717794.1 hypothetical protein [Schinkia azotoformans]MEC1743574.1 hypothetical protein [Schinkia azotoformans]MEC1746552.1 hypothetical protein [Schinkia azotoformans]MEC1757804.1 hypothetical protein [Schinkia azotoformans]MEC1769301.1 hypothetical protein [Schinkia azotoformans]
MKNHLTISKSFAVELMATLGMEQRTINAFKRGVIYKTNPLNPNHLDLIDEEDKKVIRQLEEYGCLVYHILHSSMRWNNIPADMVNYLCVPKNILIESGFDEGEIKCKHQRDSIINDFIEENINSAKSGCIFAFVVNKTWGISEPGDIFVTRKNGVLARIN